jgi:hypothetical protein
VDLPDAQARARETFGEVGDVLANQIVSTATRITTSVLPEPVGACSKNACCPSSSNVEISVTAVR